MLEDVYTYKWPQLMKKIIKWHWWWYRSFCLIHKVQYFKTGWIPKRCVLCECTVCRQPKVEHCRRSSIRGHSVMISSRGNKVLAEKREEWTRGSLFTLVLCLLWGYENGKEQHCLHLFLREQVAVCGKKTFRGECWLQTLGKD